MRKGAGASVPAPPHTNHVPLHVNHQESIRKNFILVYELLDEMMDYGYAQATSTESLKNHVYNEPILVESAKPNLRIPSINSKTTPSTAVQKPITISGALLSLSLSLSLLAVGVADGHICGWSTSPQLNPLSFSHTHHTHPSCTQRNRAGSRRTRSSWTSWNA